MLLVHKIELKPNRTQATYFLKACGVARFSYNWALEEWGKWYQAGLKPKESELRKKLNQIKTAEFPWMLEVTKVAPQQAIKNLGNAFKRFFSKQGKYPKFKKRGIHDAFRADNGPSSAGDNAAEIDEKKIKLPRVGWVRLKEKLRFKGQIKSVTISKRADRWFAAVSVEIESLPHERKNQGSVGVDLGIKHLAVLSNGEKIEGHKAHSNLLEKLKRTSRALSRKIKGGQNYQKAKLNLSRLHLKISQIRENSLHQLSTYLVLNYKKICIEDLNISGMSKNRKLSRHIMDQGFYELRRQLTYKSAWYGSDLLMADRFYPSSKLCHCCGYKNQDLVLSDRTWTCSNCQSQHDRDLNAALNLRSLLNKEYKCSSTASSAGIKACGEAGSGDGIKPIVKPVSLKQEFNIKIKETSQ